MNIDILEKMDDARAEMKPRTVAAQLLVPQGRRYVTTDARGRIEAHIDKPFPNEKYGFWMSDSPFQLGFDIPREDWRNTLIDLEVA